MSKSLAHLGIVVLVSLAAAIPAAYAVCLDPKTLVSGYQVPLNAEIQLTKFIAIGTVTKKQSLQEDPSDPEGITAYIYTVQILRQLKGRVPQVIEMRTENDSGRYSMEVGERHLLFLGKEGQYFIADSCGNSSALPAGNATLKKVEASWRNARMHPNRSLHPTLCFRQNAGELGRWVLLSWLECCPSIHECA